MGDWIGWLTRVGIAPTRLPRTGWGRRLDAVARHGLTGSLLQAWSDGLVDLVAHESDELLLRHAAAVQTSLQLEQELVRMQHVLTTFGMVVFKGPGLARQTDPDRTFTDLDVLVPAGGLRGPVRALLRMGYARTWPDPTPGYLQHTARAVALRHPAGPLVDVHRHVSPGVHGIPTTEIADAAETFDVGGTAVRVPRPDHHAVLVALHAVVGHDLTRPTILRDLHLLGTLQRVGDDRIRDLAHRWDVLDHVARALGARDRLLASELPDSLPDVAEVHDDDPSLDVLVRDTSVATASRIRGAVVPSPAFVRARYGSVAGGYVTRWRRLGQLLRRGGR